MSTVFFFFGGHFFLFSVLKKKKVKPTRKNKIKEKDFEKINRQRERERDAEENEQKRFFFYRTVAVFRHPVADTFFFSFLLACGLWPIVLFLVFGFWLFVFTIFF